MQQYINGFENEKAEMELRIAQLKQQVLQG